MKPRHLSPAVVHFIVHAYEMSGWLPEDGPNTLSIKVAEAAERRGLAVLERDGARILSGTLTPEGLATAREYGAR